MKERKLKVFVNQSPSGHLSYENDLYVFNYEEECKDVVSLTMPMRSQSWTDKKLHPIFQMNMPEGALKDAIREQFSKIRKMDDIGFLELIGSYMLGRIKFNGLKVEEEQLKLENILHNNKEDLFTELLDKFAIRSGVSGVQPKLLLSAHNKTTMKFEHFIVKSWTKEYPQLALNEYFCMRAINNANLKTPKFYLSDDLSMFVIKRFDIKEDASYLGFEDMCVLTARGTEAKYDGSYEECVRVIKDIISPEHKKKTLKIFFKAIVMNHLLKNGDGHLKNYGILYENSYKDAYLAPIYDVITTTVYIQKDIPALRMSDGKLWWKQKTYKNFAKQSCGLSNKEFDDIVQECKKAIVATKKEILLFENDSLEVEDFLKTLHDTWVEEIV